MRIQITIESANVDDVEGMRRVLASPYAAQIMECVAKLSEHGTITVRESERRPKMTPVEQIVTTAHPVTFPEGWTCGCGHRNPKETVHCFACGRSSHWTDQTA